MRRSAASTIATLLIGTPLISLALAGCQAVPDLARDQALAELTAEVHALRTHMESTDGALANLSNLQTAQQTAVSTSLAGIDSRLKRLPRSIQSACSGTAPQPARENCSQQAQVVSTEGRMLLGELEHVWLEPPGINVTARVDSGAESSSVNAQNLVEFERDGADWVRFEWALNGETVTIERPVERYVRVVQQADPEGTRRPVVSLRLRVGETEDDFDFSLADRSHLDHQMNLGRNFLTDVAIVDVSRKFVQPKRGSN